MAKTKSLLLAGTTSRLLFSPQGGIEGVLLQLKDGLAHVSTPPELADYLVAKARPGKRLRLLATADASPKTRTAVNSVYTFDAFADAQGEAVELPESSTGTTVKGVVADIHYARHGEPNGVILETGEFIHLKPHGMEQTGVQVGDKINAWGESRMTILGTRMLEAHWVNDISL